MIIMKNQIKTKQIVVLSGKGGTGKTSITAALSFLAKNKTVVDCDVDAANLYLLLNPKINSETEFFGGKKAFIDESKCSKCGLCEEVCRFDAITEFVVDQISCEGCGFCYRVCPDNAISFLPNKSGSFFEGILSDESKFIDAKLLPGEGNSGRLVSEIKKTATDKFTDNTEWIIVDGSPGIGCPVNASLSGADYVVLVTEPTLSGVHDLRRVMELLETFKIPFGVIINKYDINTEITENILSLIQQKKSTLLGKVAFNENFIHSLRQGKTIVEYEPTMKQEMETIWMEIKKQIKSFN